jgi:prepilin peptidase CpaA
VTLTIPNWISLTLVALFPLVALAAGLTLGDAGLHVAVGVGALLVGMTLFAGNFIGGGDAKLFAAIALYMGTGWIAAYLFAVAIAGGALAVAMLALRWAAHGPFAPYLARLQHLTRAGAGIPYGIAIAAGGLLVFPSTPLFAVAAAAS